MPRLGGKKAENCVFISLRTAADTLKKEILMIAPTGRINQRQARDDAEYHAGIIVALCSQPCYLLHV